MSWLFETAILKNDEEAFIRFPMELCSTEHDKKLLNFVKSYLQSYKKLPPLVSIQEKLPTFMSMEPPHIADVPYLFDREVEERTKTLTEEAFKQFSSGSITMEQLRHRMAELDALAAINYNDKGSIQDWSEWNLGLYETVTNSCSWGIPLLDKATEGIRNGDYIIIAGRPGKGKTTFFLRLALRYWLEGKHICLVSREMTPEDVFGKMISMAVGFDSLLLRSPHKIDFNLNLKIQTFRESLGKMDNKVIVPHTIISSPMALQTFIKKSSSKRPFDVIMIDAMYLMKLSSKRASTASSWEETAAISGGLRNIALDCKVPLIATTQLRRDNSSSESSKKGEAIDQIAYSDSIAQDATAMVYLQRVVQDGNNKTKYSLIKNRWGQADVHGYFMFNHNDSSFSFEEPKENE